MIIHRSDHESGFAIIPNTTLRDQRLSYKARGVLGELLSRPDDWATTADALSRSARADRGLVGEGRNALRAVFRELEAAGYLIRRAQRGGRGRFDTVLHVFDTPDLSRAWLAGEEFQVSVDNFTPGGIFAGQTGDPMAGHRSDLGRPASPQVGPATGPPYVGRPGVGQRGVGPPGVSTKTYDEDRVRPLTSPVPVESENGSSDQKRFSDEEWAARERVAARQVGPLPEAAS